MLYKFIQHPILLGQIKALSTPTCPLPGSQAGRASSCLAIATPSSRVNVSARREGSTHDASSRARAPPAASTRARSSPGAARRLERIVLLGCAEHAQADGRTTTSQFY